MTKVKICGLSEPAALNAAIEMGADFVGFVFFEKSPRNVSLATAKELASIARGRAKIVVLTVDAHDEMLARIAEVVRPDYFQLQGNETPERVAEIRKLTKVAVIKAIKVADASDIAKAQAFHGIADLIHYDAKAPETLQGALPGGNGLAFDWSLLNKGEGGYILAGGLNPQNVAEAVRVTKAPIVDVSSGVEKTPGVKDEVLIRKFIEAAKNAG